MKQGIESITPSSSCGHPSVQALVEKNALLEQENQQLKSKYEALLEQVRLFKHQRFGASSEKFHPGQQDLFNEAEASVADSQEVEADDLVNVPETATLPQGQKKRGRKALPPELPRIEIIHELPEAQRCCPEGHELKVIGEEVSEQLDIIPAKIQVLRHICKKYACSCGQCIKTAKFSGYE